MFISSVFTYAQDTIKLTDQEREYLASRGPIKIVVDPDWYPYEKIDRDGEYVGVASELIDMIAKRISVKFEIVPTTEWKESLKKAKSGDVDAVSFLKDH